MTAATPTSTAHTISAVRTDAMRLRRRNRRGDRLRLSSLSQGKSPWVGTLTASSAPHPDLMDTRRESFGVDLRRAARAWLPGGRPVGAQRRGPRSGGVAQRPQCDAQQGVSPLISRPSISPNIKASFQSNSAPLARTSGRSGHAPARTVSFASLTRSETVCESPAGQRSTSLHCH